MNIIKALIFSSKKTISYEQQEKHDIPQALTGPLIHGEEREGGHRPIVHVVLLEEEQRQLSKRFKFDVAELLRPFHDNAKRSPLPFVAGNAQPELEKKPLLNSGQFLFKSVPRHRQTRIWTQMEKGQWVSCSEAQHLEVGGGLAMPESVKEKSSKLTEFLLTDPLVGEFSETSGSDGTSNMYFFRRPEWQYLEAPLWPSLLARTDGNTCFITLPKSAVLKGFNPLLVKWSLER